MANQRERDLAESLLSVAEMCMPNTYFETDSRCKIAREVLHEYEVREKQMETFMQDLSGGKFVYVEDNSNTSFVFSLTLPGEIAIKFSEIASKRDMNPLELLREMVENHVRNQ